MSSCPLTSAFHCSFGLNSDAPDDLHHLVADVSLAARKLVRCAQHRRRRQGRTGDRGERKRRRDSTPLVIPHVASSEIYGFSLRSRCSGYRLFFAAHPPIGERISAVTLSSLF